MENKNGAKENKRKTGSRYEDIAARFLSLKGYTVLERNYRIRTAEIDIIARDADTLAFVEVKYRKTGEQTSYLIEDLADEIKKEIAKEQNKIDDNIVEKELN